MFSRTAKSVVQNLGQRCYHIGTRSRKIGKALVSAAERSRVPGILTPLVEQTAGKPALNAATTSEQNGLVTFAMKQNSLNEKLKTPGAKMCDQYNPDVKYKPKDGQEKMLFINGESDCGDYPFLRNYRDPGTSSVQAIGKKNEKRSFGFECPSKKPSDFFSSVSNGEGTEMAEPGGDLLSATLKPRESTILGWGSRHRFLTRKDAGRSTAATVVHSLLSVLAPDRDTPRRWYGKCDNGPKSPKDQQPDCPTSKKTPPCTPKPQTCPPSKVRFRECPPPPKLPKLPKCPPPCPPPTPPPVPKCPVPPKCPPPCAPPQNSPKGKNSPPCSPPKRKCSGRKMSTYGFFHRDCKCVSADETIASKLFRQRFPVFLVTRRRISSSSSNFASKGKSGKKSDNQGSKSCKKNRETKKNCSSKKDGRPKSNESEKDCHVRPKDPATDCRAKSRNRVTKRAKDCSGPKSRAKCSESCVPRPRCTPVPPPPRSTTRVEWSPPICPPPRLVKPPPCPGKSKKACPGQLETLKPPCPPPPPLPKPPCRPVCLCPCPPPPKIPPGSCPDVPAVEEPNPSCPPPPCPPKVQTPCPKDDWCPSKPICPPKK